MRGAVALVMVLLSATGRAGPGRDVPRPPGEGFVLDQTGTLRGETVFELEAIARAIDASGRGQLGVLVLRTTGGEAPRRFATDVFNAWGVGHRDRDDGVLLLLVLDDRKAELVVGRREPLVKAQTDAIMSNDVVAHMKRQDPDGALLAAARSIQRELGRAGVAPAPAAHCRNELDEGLAAFMRRERPFPDRTPRAWVMDLSDSLSASERAELEVLGTEVYAEGKGRLVFVHVATGASWPSLGELLDVMARQVEPSSRLPLAVVALNRLSGDTAIRLPETLLHGEWELDQVRRAREAMRAKRSLLAGGRFAAQALRSGIPPKPMDEVLREALERHAGPFGGGLAAMVAGAGLWLRRWLRRRPRICTHCHHPRERLGEDADDGHLTPAQRTEERLRSVDYDVWYCGRCNDALVLRYGAWFSRYGVCRHCGAKAATSSSTTVVAATEHSTGLVRVTESCQHCLRTHTSDRVTARLDPPQPTSHSSSTWSSSASSGGFGGGSSAGGGSSGSW